MLVGAEEPKPRCSLGVGRVSFKVGDVAEVLLSQGCDVPRKNSTSSPGQPTL